MELIVILLGIAFFGGLLANNNDDASIERRSTMDLIIKIPDEQYNDIVKHLTDNDGNYAYSDYNLREIIRNGTPYNPATEDSSHEAGGDADLLNRLEELQEANAKLERRLNALISCLYPTCISKDDVDFIDSLEIEKSEDK